MFSSLRQFTSIVVPNLLLLTSGVYAAIPTGLYRIESAINYQRVQCYSGNASLQVDYYPAIPSTYELWQVDDGPSGGQTITSAAFNQTVIQPQSIQGSIIQISPVTEKYYSIDATESNADLYTVTDSSSSLVWALASSDASSTTQIALNTADGSSSQQFYFISQSS